MMSTAGRAGAAAADGAGIVDGEDAADALDAPDAPDAPDAVDAVDAVDAPDVADVADAAGSCGPEIQKRPWANTRYTHTMSDSGASASEAIITNPTAGHVCRPLRTYSNWGHWLTSPWS